MLTGCGLGTASICSMCTSGSGQNVLCRGTEGPIMCLQRLHPLGLLTCGTCSGKLSSILPSRLGRGALLHSQATLCRITELQQQQLPFFTLISLPARLPSWMAVFTFIPSLTHPFSTHCFWMLAALCQMLRSRGKLDRCGPCCIYAGSIHLPEGIDIKQKMITLYIINYTWGVCFDGEAQ